MPPETNMVKIKMMFTAGRRGRSLRESANPAIICTDTAISVPSTVYRMVLRYPTQISALFKTSS